MQKVRRKSRTFGVHYIDLRPGRAWGFRVVYYGDVDLNHEWASADVTNVQGVTYNLGDKKFKNKTHVNLDPETLSYIREVQRAHTAQ